MPGLREQARAETSIIAKKKGPATGAEIEIGSLWSGHEASFIEFDKDQAVDVCNNTETISAK